MNHVFPIAFLAFNIYIWLVLLRNHQTYRFFNQLLIKISLLSNQDIDQGKPWKWRYEELEKVSYAKVLFSVGTRFEPKCYWKDLSFLEEGK